MSEFCYVCKSPVHSINKGFMRNIHKVNCYRCGLYRIDGSAVDDINSTINSYEQRANLSGYIFEHQNELLTYDFIEAFTKKPTPLVDEKAQKLLVYFSKKAPHPGRNLDQIPNELFDIVNQLIGGLNVSLTQSYHNWLKTYLPYYAAAWAVDSAELNFILKDYLTNHKKYIDGSGRMKISPHGWSFLGELQKRKVDSNIVFLAMEFADPIIKFSEKWVEDVIDDCGYEALRIDKHPHNALIDDEIFAQIKRSKFIVADFTNNNNGVYFESGYAFGLDIPVISICNKEYFNTHKEEVHFDVNHYQFLFWEEGDEKFFQKNLKNRIIKTIGIYE